MNRLRIVIVGRPNVGKSSLFNRLFGRRRALVHDEPGVTRDRLEEQLEWQHGKQNLPITLIDTGGLGGERFAEEISRQVDMALREADVVLALFDAQAGYTPADESVIRGLQRSGLLGGKGELDRKVQLIGVVNKIDDEVHESLLNDFFQSGIDPLFGVSAEHNRGIEDLKLEIIRAAEGLGKMVADKSQDSDEDRWDDQPNEDESESSEHLDVDDDSDWEESNERDAEEEKRLKEPPRVAIVGRPNAGKSTLVNTLLREERMIVSPVAGTTVDAVDSPARLGDLDVILVDTAGIRRKSKTERGVEVLSVIQTQKALEKCDLAILLLDGEGGITEQDEKIGGLIEQVGCSVILMVNKWDTQKANEDFSREQAAELVRKKMAYLRYAPLLFVSAKYRQGLKDLGDLVQEVMDQRRVKLTTKEFTEWVRKESEVHNPMDARFYLCHQASRYPPTFVCHVNDPKKVHFSLKRHLVNAIRDRWGFMGTPIRLLVKPGKDRKGPRRKKDNLGRPLHGPGSPNKQ
ncbi:MAG: ribosome biogenesis GTPase Der [Bdellovibrionales bacterium]|nr:ribosome biogenesis GTPase Der [Bdellovibrionales bacterium]